jgi:hypothetical protein
MTCELCVEPILSGEPKADTVQPFHRECLFRAVMGGANHILKRCSCYGGAEPPDPPGLTMREAARAAWRAYLSIQHKLVHRPHAGNGKGRGGVGETP